MLPDPVFRTLAFGLPIRLTGRLTRMSPALVLTSVCIAILAPAGAAPPVDVRPRLIVPAAPNWPDSCTAVVLDPLTPDLPVIVSVPAELTVPWWVAVSS